ncbi:MAG: hypothetical protein PHV34_03755 [Verrucomicrobiae bacterium]|nr:hypothetical protein [Verrucomicrobiae bacterium]
MSKDFDKLAGKILGGEGSEQEKRAFEKLSNGNAAKKQEFDGVREVLDVLKTGMPLASAMDASQPVLPEYRMSQLLGKIKTPAREEPPEKVQAAPETEVFWWDWVRERLGVGLACAAVMAVVFLALLMPSGHPVEVGVCQEYATRGSAALPVFERQPGLGLVTFDGEKAFEKWRSAPLAWNQKARLWIDEETGVLRIIHRDAAGRIQQDSVPWPDDGRGQEKALKEALDKVRR